MSSWEGRCSASTARGAVCRARGTWHVVGWEQLFCKRHAEEYRDAGYGDIIADAEWVKHRAGLQAAQAVAHWHLGDSYWADRIVSAYRNPERALARLARDKRES